jgi:hypothetical protein
MRKGKQQLPLLQNKAYCDIIFYLIIEEDNSFGLAKRMSKTQGIIWRHLQKLADDKLIISSEEKKNAYSVNLNEIQKKFIQYLNKRVSLTKPKKLESNIIIKEAIISAFKEYFNSIPKEDNKTIIDLFEIIYRESRLIFSNSKDLDIQNFLKNIEESINIENNIINRIALDLKALRKKGDILEREQEKVNASQY